MTAYAELQITTNFSFLRGASHPEEMALQAAAFGHVSVGIADRNSLSGSASGRVSTSSTAPVCSPIQATASPMAAWRG